VNDYRSSHLDARCPAQFEGHYIHGHGHLYWNHFERPYLETLFARLGRECPGRYLDFACGTGRILELASPHFIETVGIDVSEAMLSEARRRFPTARLIQVDVMTDPPDVGTFQVISLFRFILSAEDHLREGVLHWLRKVIAPGGVLVVNNHLNQWSITGLRHRLRNVVRGRPGGPPTERHMETLLRRCGFEIVEAYGFGIIPPWRHTRRSPSTLLLRLERLLGASRRLQAYAKDRIYLCRPIEAKAGGGGASVARRSQPTRR
jgi:ubiquinone/menaquinone biosynthesis C-methylase UbiE